MCVRFSGIRNTKTWSKSRNKGFVARSGVKLMEELGLGGGKMNMHLLKGWVNLLKKLKLVVVEKWRERVVI